MESCRAVKKDKAVQYILIGKGLQDTVLREKKKSKIQKKNTVCSLSHEEKLYMCFAGK